MTVLDWMGIILAQNRVLVFNIKLQWSDQQNKMKTNVQTILSLMVAPNPSEQVYYICWRRKMLRSCQKEPWQSFPFLHICICQGSNGDNNHAHENVNTCFTFKRPLDSHSHPSICVCQGSIVSWPPIWRPTTQRALCACRQLANTFLAFHFTLTLRTSSSKYACFCHCCKCFRF